MVDVTWGISLIAGTHNIALLSYIILFWSMSKTGELLRKQTNVVFFIINITTTLPYHRTEDMNVVFFKEGNR